jgi:N-acetyl-anhydromuramyl-L-alanine amidase AmpD
MNIINKIGQYRNEDWYKRDIAGINYIVVHHSASRMQDNEDAMLQQHMNAHTGGDNNWPGLSYHFVIAKSGNIYQINEFDDLTYTDGINSESLAILVDGFFHPDVNEVPTLAQLSSLQELLDNLSNEHPEFPAGQGQVVGHREHSHLPTACPGENLIQYVIRYRDTGRVLDNTTINPNLQIQNEENMLKQQLISSINTNSAFSQADKDGLINAVNVGDMPYVVAFSGGMPRQWLGEKEREIIRLTDELQKKVTIDSKVADLEREVSQYREKYDPNKFISVEKHKSEIDKLTGKNLSTDVNTSPILQLIEKFSLHKFFIGFAKNGTLHGATALTAVPILEFVISQLQSQLGVAQNSEMTLLTLLTITVVTSLIQAIRWTIGKIKE